VHDGDNQQRPEHIELLFDGEAPRVVQRRRAPEERPVVVACEDRPPVREVADRRERVAADGRELVGLREHPRVQRDRGKHADQCGQQPARPPHPERAERDPPPVACLREQQRRDEETGEDEERVDSEKTAGQVSAVEEQHGGDSKAAQAVERGLMNQARVRTRRARRELRGVRSYSLRRPDPPRHARTVPLPSLAANNETAQRRV
jgi:hypothetical protein